MIKTVWAKAYYLQSTGRCFDMIKNQFPIQGALMALTIVGASLASSPAIAADAVVGATTFKQKCQMCHTIASGQAGTIGPNLAGVVGRKAGSTTFNYSPQLKTYGKPWTAALLEQWLAGPAKLVPGTRMVVSVSDSKDRDNVIAYLATLRK